MPIIIEGRGRGSASGVPLAVIPSRGSLSPETQRLVNIRQLRLAARDTGAALPGDLVSKGARAAVARETPAAANQRTAKNIERLLSHLKGPRLETPSEAVARSQRNRFRLQAHADAARTAETPEETEARMRDNRRRLQLAAR